MSNLSGRPYASVGSHVYPSPKQDGTFCYFVVILFYDGTQSRWPAVSGFQSAEAARQDYKSNEPRWVAFTEKVIQQAKADRGQIPDYSINH